MHENEDEVALYSSFISCSTVNQKAWLSESACNPSMPLVNVLKSLKDLDENNSRLFYESYSYSVKENEYFNIREFPAEIVKTLLFSQAPSQRKSISIKAVDKKQILEFSSRETSFRFDFSKIHGDVMVSGWFGGYSWSYDERYFIFVAKQLQKENLSIFSPDYGKKTEIGSKFEFVENWGEKFEDVSNLVFSVVDTFEQTVKIVPNIDNDHQTIGQPIFRPSKESKYEIVYTAWSTSPRKLGMIYCYQRPCSLYHVDLTTWLSSESTVCEIRHSAITTSLALSRSPRFNADGSMLVFLGRTDEMTTHNGCMELFLIRELSCLAPSVSSSIDCLVRISHRPDIEGFMGVYCDQLPHRCFHSNDRFVVFPTLRGCRDVIASVDIHSKQIFLNFENILSESITRRGLATDVDESSVVLHDILGSTILLSRSNPISPTELFTLNTETCTVHTMPRLCNQIPVSVKMASDKSVKHYLNNYTFKIYQHKADDGIVFESIVIYPRIQEGDDSAIPLVLVPHGGPHSCLTNSFYFSYAYLCKKLNAGVVLVNYRGSTGYGEDSICSLLGRIGRNDVDDCMVALRHALLLPMRERQEEPAVPMFDAGRVGVVGGSHGGFLTAHLIGQFPLVFKAACMRNPVTNIPSMVTATDIPDWCWEESGATYNFTSFEIPSEDVLIAMRRASPCIYSQNVVTPTLICLGSKDRRVPPSQGLEYYHQLRSRGIPCKLLVFPEDDHAIDKPTTEGEQWVAIAAWLQKYL